MYKNTFIGSLLVALLYVCTAQAALPDYLYEEWRKSPYPAKGQTVTVNPSPLLWPSARYWEKREVSYNVYLSQDSLFPADRTYRSLNQKYCMYNPHRKLEEGKWFWKYEEVENGKVIPKGTYSFHVASGTEGTVTPDFRSFVENIMKEHPRVMNYGRSMEEIHAKAPSHPLYAKMIREAEKVVAAEPYRGGSVGCQSGEGPSAESEGRQRGRGFPLPARGIYPVGQEGDARCLAGADGYSADLAYG